VVKQKRSQWEIGRFVETLSFFDVIPFLGCFQRLLMGKKQEKVNQPGERSVGVILVAGATGGVGKRVVSQLKAESYPIRALVRSIERGKPMLGEDIDYYEGDITIPESLKPELMADVETIICCTGTRVQPVEGDTPTREKYYQGVKFYEPEIAESTPEAVEYKGIQNLVNLAKQYIKNPSVRTIFDFTQPTAEVKSLWGAVDDVVMGGVSESGIRLADDRAVFSGNVSTDNNGGFASVRTRNFEPALDISTYEGFELRLKGDGKRYKFISRCEDKWDGVGYSYSFDTVKDEWITVHVPFSDLIPVFRAKTVPEAKFDPSQLRSLQLMLSKFEYDKSLNPNFDTGYFQLEVKSIKAYGGDPKPQFVMISSAGVTRPGREDINLEEEPPAVRMNDQLGGILTWKLRGEEAVRESGLTYTIIRPCALTEDKDEKALEVDQGDTMKGQVSRDAIAQLCITASQSPQACQKTFEVRESSENNQPSKGQVLFTNLQSD
jgi:uncharacterized protein YbjT (DUF2867 family)